MPADQLLYQMDPSANQNEWYDFENFFEFPDGFVDSNPTSVNSISPKDYDLTYTDLDGVDWDSAAGMMSQSALADLDNSEMPLDLALDVSELTADPNDFLQFPAPSPKEDLGLPVFEGQWPMDLSSNINPYFSDLRHMVETQAAIAPCGLSKKEKRREAGIAIHLQRLQDNAMPSLEFSPDVNGFPSPSSSQARGSVSHGGPSESPASTSLSYSTSKSSTPPLTADATSRGMELVLDLNMNTPSNLPKKQKPRSRAQKENYIKVRKHGACEKHRKQHKRCNCLDQAAARLSVNPSALVAPNRLVQSVKPLSLQTNGLDQRQAMRPTAPRQDIPSNIQSTRVVDQNHLDRVVYLDQHHVHPGSHANPRVNTYEMPSLRVSRPTDSAGVGNPRLEVRPPNVSDGHRIDQVASPRVQATKSPRPSSLMAVRSPDRSPTTLVRDAANSNVPGVQSTVRRRPEQSVNLASERCAIGRQPPRPDHGTIRAQSIPGKPVIAAQPTTHADSSVLNSVSTTIANTVGVLSTYLQRPTSATSWAAGLFGRFVIFSSRQYLLARKGMGLY